MKLNLIFLLALFAGLSVNIAWVEASPRRVPAGNDDYIPGEVLVKYRSGSESAGRGSVRAMGSPVVRSAAPWDKVKLGPGWDVQRAVVTLRQNPAVEWAQPNYRYHALQCTPASTDSYYNDDGQGWAFQIIRAPQAWALLGTCAAPPGSSAVTVAVLDTGADAAHVDLVGQLLPGYNTVSDTPDTSDDEGHGTFVTGLLTATWGNGGMAGLATGIRVIPIKVLDNHGNGSSDSIASGVQRAVTMGAKVLNLSLGGAGMGSAEQSAYDQALAAGCVIVAAAGNEGGPLDYPAAYPPVLAVGATGPSDQLTWYTNTGTGLDLVAPGGMGLTSNYDPTHDMFSLAWPTPLPYPTPQPLGYKTGDNRYGTGAGTSFSTPLVTGAAALVWSLYPSATSRDVVARLIYSADDLGQPGWDPQYGWGRLNLEAALAPVVITPTTTPTPAPVLVRPQKPILAPDPFNPGVDPPGRVFTPLDSPRDLIWKVFDLAGQLVLERRINASELSKGVQGPMKDILFFTWDGRTASGAPLASGLYPVVVESAGMRWRGLAMIARGHR